MQALATSAGRTVRRDRLNRQVWGYAMARGDRTVDVNGKRLRAKLAGVARGRLEIRTQPASVTASSFGSRQGRLSPEPTALRLCNADVTGL